MNVILTVIHWLLPTASLNALLLFGLKALAFAAIAYFWPKAKVLLAHILLSHYARYVVPYVQRLFGDLSGAQRMQKAVSLVDTWLRRWHCPFTLEEIEAAIEAAWAQYKAAGTLAVYKAKKAAPTKAPAQPEVQTPPAASPAAPATPAAPASDAPVATPAADPAPTTPPAK